MDSSPKMRLEDLLYRRADSEYLWLRFQDAADQLNSLLKNSRELADFASSARYFRFQVKMTWKQRDITGLPLGGHQAPELQDALRHILLGWLFSHILNDHEEEILARNYLRSEAATLRMSAHKRRTNSENPHL